MTHKPEDMNWLHEAIQKEADRLAERAKNMRPFPPRPFFAEGASKPPIEDAEYEIIEPAQLPAKDEAV